MDQNFDLVVIGAGSGGLAAAKRASSYGARVALVEGDKVGGTCVIRGCVPKKLLVYGSQVSEHLADAPSYGVDVPPATINSSVLLQAVRAEVDRLNALHVSFLEKAHMQSIQAIHLSPHRLQKHRGVDRCRRDIDAVARCIGQVL